MYHVRLAAHGFKHQAGVSFYPKKIFARVVHDITVQIIFVLLLCVL